MTFEVGIIILLIVAYSETAKNLYSTAIKKIEYTTRYPDVIFKNKGIDSIIYEYINDLNVTNDLVNEGSHLNATQLIQKFGYSFEEHSVVTEDGYILTVQRIPRNNTAAVLLMHGLFDSSDTWLIASSNPDRCLPLILADAGYDVWLGNTRGNQYSRAHENLDPEQPEFWRFSFDELGLYDLPAMIDFILKVNLHPNLFYIGHSQGATAFFAMCSLRPKYNAKIKLMVALAPVAWVTTKHMNINTSTVFPFSIPGAAEMLELADIFEIFPRSKNLSNALNALCSNNSRFQRHCLDKMFQFIGTDYELMNLERLPIYLSHSPAGASMRQITHYAQEKISGKFRRYDHGLIGNLKAYGSYYPPEFDVQKITAPKAFFYADNDFCTGPEDIQKIISSFPHIVLMYKVPHKTFNHIDFLWAYKARTLVYDKVMAILRIF